VKLWITGANGLVATALQDLCKKQKISFLATSHQEVDISSTAQVKELFYSYADITHIINCAAYTNVDEAEKETEAAFKANTLGPENLGKLAHRKNLKMIHLSTDYVFDSKETSLLQEHDPCTPSSVYAKTKHEGEIRLLEQCPRCCIIRTSWIFGKGGKNFISSLREKLQKDEPLAVVNDQFNRLTYAKDLAQAILSLLCHKGIYHFANQGLTSRYEVANQMKTLLQEKGHSCACKEITPASKTDFLTLAPRPQFSALDTYKIERVLGQAPRSWQNALQEYVNDTV
jgi:dTDP-4-dehydrorhamnose reductase